MTNTCSTCNAKPVSKFHPFECDDCLQQNHVAPPEKKPLPANFNYEQEYFELLDKVVKLRSRMREHSEKLQVTIDSPECQYKSGLRGKQKTINHLVHDLDFILSKNRKAIEARYGKV